MPYCSNCGSHVTNEYVRVMGINSEVHACPSCPDRVMDPEAEGGFREYTFGTPHEKIAADGGDE